VPWLEYLKKNSEFNIRLYDKNSESNIRELWIKVSVNIEKKSEIK
jgi:hypothetical protein